MMATRRKPDVSRLQATLQARAINAPKNLAQMFNIDSKQNQLLLSIGEKGSDRNLAKPSQLSPLGLYTTMQNMSPQSKKKLDDYAQVSPTARLKQMFKESSSFANKVDRASKSCLESVTLPAVGGRMSQKSRVSVGEFGRQLLAPSTL